MQLVEESLDTNLLNNAIRLKFSSCSVLPGGVTIQETLNNIIILICTNQSVHRLVLPHPARMYRSVSPLKNVSCSSRASAAEFQIIFRPFLDMLSSSDQIYCWFLAGCCGDVLLCITVDVCHVFCML